MFVYWFLCMFTCIFVFMFMLVLITTCSGSFHKLSGQDV